MTQFTESVVEDAALIVSDGVQARIGTFGAGREWFKPWRTITGRGHAGTSLAELQVVLEGVFDKRRFLDAHPLVYYPAARRAHGATT